MPRKSPEDKLAELKAQRMALRQSFDDKLKKVDDQLKATQAKLAAEERKILTRQKIIAGAVALEHAEKNPEWGKEFWALLDKAVTKKDQRETLGLSDTGQ